MTSHVYDPLTAENAAQNLIAKLRMMLTGCRATHGNHLRHLRIEQALAQHTLADHTGGPEDQDTHCHTLSHHADAGQR